MKIQELERKTGLERPSIRFYEKEGLLNPQRQENGYRDYSDQDVELLKKIKLLRRLGMSVEKIRQLQQGSADLTTVIAQLVSHHSSQIDDHRRCRAVCEAIRDDQAAFASLDAEHYLRLLREIRIDDRAIGRTDFQESIPQEIHPWRRWFARWLDYLLWGAVAEVIWIVLLRVRPMPGDFGNVLFSVAVMALFVPVEALLLHKFGTTPGKYVMGIRLEYIQGGNLPYAEALYRSLRVFTQGAGLGIPIVSLFSYLFCFCQLTGRSYRLFSRYDEVKKPESMPWDEETELIYTDWNRKRGVVLAILLAAALGMSVWSISDGFKPRYRGDALTVSQVSSNYNATISILDRDVAYYDKLLEDGTKKPVAANTVIVDMNNRSGSNQMTFFYDVQAGYVRSVEIHHSWDSVIWLQPVQGDPYLMAVSLLLAQDNCGIAELMEFTKLYESHLDQKETAFSYGNLLIEWRIESQKDMLDGIIYADNEENVTATVDFKVTIR